jgi:hypothetical protein
MEIIGMQKKNQNANAFWPDQIKNEYCTSKLYLKTGSLNFASFSKEESSTSL